MKNFDAYQNGRAIVREMRPIIAVIKERSASLADQLERASTSLTHNLCEGSGRAGRDRRRFFGYAQGSLREITGAINNAIDLGWPIDTSVVEPLLDRERAMLWRLTH